MRRKTKLLLLLLLVGFSELLMASSIAQDTSKPSDLQEAFESFFRKPEDRGPATLSSQELALLKEGDFILRKGYGWVSDRIANLLNEEYAITHCGLILTEGYNRPHVLHSMSNELVDGVFVEPLSDFLRESQPAKLVAVRLKCSKQDKKAVIKEAKRLLAKKIPFDLAFNDADTSAMYCAELTCYYLRQVFGKDMLPEKAAILGRNVVRMRNFLDPRNFEVLFNQWKK